MMSQDRNMRMLMACLGLVAGMGALSYASVPLYRMFCQLTGFDGTPLRAERAPDHVLEQTITVRFDANVSQDLDWEFAPKQANHTLKLGETGLIFYRAANRAGKPTVGTASFNVTPEKAAPYFNKIACFCFDRQELKAGQAMDMGVTFFIDPAIMKDRAVRDLREITLSYTFYPAKGGERLAEATNSSKR